MLKKANKRLFMLRTRSVLDLAVTSFMLCTVAMWDRFLSTLMLCGIQASLSNNQETLNPFKEEHVALFLGIHMNHMLMLWVPVNLTLCLKGGRTIVIVLLKGCLILSGLNLFSLFPDLSVMATPYVTVPIFRKFLLGRSALKIVLFLIARIKTKIECRSWFLFWGKWTMKQICVKILRKVFLQRFNQVFMTTSYFFKSVNILSLF